MPRARRSPSKGKSYGRPVKPPSGELQRQKIVRAQRMHGRRYRLEGLVKDEPVPERREPVRDERDA